MNTATTKKGPNFSFNKILGTLYLQWTSTCIVLESCWVSLVVTLQTYSLVSDLVTFMMIRVASSVSLILKRDRKPKNTSGGDGGLISPMVLSVFLSVHSTTRRVPLRL